MKFLSAKKLILIGFIVVLLIAIPLTIYIIQQQQVTRTEAQQATTLSFDPQSTSANPLPAAIGQPISLDIVVDPGVNQNLVSFERLDIQYDPTVLAPVEETDTLSPFQENASALTLLEGPVFSEGNISATLSVGVDPTKVIQTRTTIATVTFLPIADSGGSPTEVSYTTTSQVLSAGTGDQANENVLVGTEPAFIQVGESTGEEEEPTATPSATLSPSPSISASPSASPTLTTTTPSPTQGATGQSGNTNPVCESLTTTMDTTGIAPYTITMNVQGSDANGTITQATFSFGDGQVQNITTGGGLTTSSVDLNVSHTYTNSGNYQASVVLTDNNGGVSTNNCSLEIVVLDEEGQLNPTSTPIPQAELMDTGPGDILIGAGAIVSLLTIIGAALFFLL